MAVNVDWFYQEFVKLKARGEVLEHAGTQQETVPLN